MTSGLSSNVSYNKGTQGFYERAVWLQKSDLPFGCCKVTALVVHTLINYRPEGTVPCLW